MAVLKSETTYYVGAFEKTTRACVTDAGGSATESVERTRVGPVLHVKRTPCGNSSADTGRDRVPALRPPGLVGLDHETRRGAELLALAHDPHGERRKPDWTRRLSQAEIETLAADHGDRTSRGFTGHEHLDRTGLVHMNGSPVRPAARPVPEPRPDRREPGRRSAMESVQLRREQPAELRRPERTDVLRPRPAMLAACGLRARRAADWGGGDGGGYSTRTVSGWSAYVTFGVYYEIVRIWSSVSVSRWDAGVEGGGSWGSTGDTFWEDVQRSVIYPIVQFFFWSFQVVEQGRRPEPATGHSAHSGNGQPMTRPTDKRRTAGRFQVPVTYLLIIPTRASNTVRMVGCLTECAVRLGIALQNVGVDISGSGEHRPTHTHDPNPAIHQPSAKALADFLEDELGRPQILRRSVRWTIEDFKDREAIIYFAHPERGGDRLLGHIDVISGRTRRKPVL